MRYAIAFVGLVLALPGCSTAQRTATCTETPMPVNVYTIGPNIDVEPYINVCRQNVQITWVIDPSQTGRYEFHADSIEIKSSDPDDEFSNCKLGHAGGQLANGGKEIRCHDKNNKRDGRQYLYNIRVYEVGSGIPITKDPIIGNN